MTDLEVYLKSKIAELNQATFEEEPNGIPAIFGATKKALKAPYLPIESMATQSSFTNESKASVYYTPNDSIEQPQLQISPMHINHIRENLDTYVGCLKPQSLDSKFDFDMHRLQAHLEYEIDRRRNQYQKSIDGYDSAEEIIEMDTEYTKMLAQKIDGYESMAQSNLKQNNIRMNTLPKRNKFKKTANGKDFYYSVENIFDQNTNQNGATGFYQLHESNKTIDEASETQLTSSASDNCSSSDSSRANQSSQSDSNVENLNPSQSALILNEISSGTLNDVQVSSSMPNISKSIDNKLSDVNQRLVVEIHTELKSNEKENYDKIGLMN